MLNGRLPRVDASRFAMTPRTDVPRSTFVTTHAVKTTFNMSDLVPIHLDEVLPGDTHQGDVTIFARLSNLIFPLMDHVELETFFFFVPIRLVWTNFVRMMGERDNPSDSISYTIPTINTPVGGWGVGTLGDYLGVPTLGQYSSGVVVTHNVLPLRAYNLIWNEWFRDENLQSSIVIAKGDSGDAFSSFVLQRRNKKHDYFTSALPWPLKGGVEVTMPLSGSAPIKGLAVGSATAPATATVTAQEQGGGALNSWSPLAYYQGNTQALYFRAASSSTGSQTLLTADLSTATGATINALRLAFLTQAFYERDARGGTRYTELVFSHFGVRPEDMRLQRPEYIGGGRTSVQTQAIPQTSATGLSGGTTPLGNLTAQATVADQHRFKYSATEHGYILGLVNVRADLTYQQGLRRLWTRSTRFDFPWPIFANLGEQAIRNDEIYYQGTNQDTQVFGYQERYAEFKHFPSLITGRFKSTAASNIDEWHMSQQFSSLPQLNSSFIQDDAQTVFTRVAAAGTNAQSFSQEVLLDSVFTLRRTRPLPMFGVPVSLGRF